MVLSLKYKSLVTPRMFWKWQGWCTLADHQNTDQPSSVAVLGAMTRHLVLERGKCSNPWGCVHTQVCLVDIYTCLTVNKQEVFL